MDIYYEPGTTAGIFHIASLLFAVTVSEHFSNSLLSPESLSFLEDGLTAICCHVWVFLVSNACLVQLISLGAGDYF